MVPTCQSNSSNLNTQKAFLKIPGFTSYRANRPTSYSVSCTLPKSHSRTIGAFTNDLLHKTTYIPIKLALFWVMLGSWPFESKQILIWLFQKGIIQLCRSKGCQMTSPQSCSLELKIFGVPRHLRRRRVLAQQAPIPPNSISLPDFEGW